MSENFKSKKPFITWAAIYAGIWLLLSILSSSQVYSNYIFENRPGDWRYIYVSQMSFWIIWGILGLFVIKLSKRFRLEGEARRKNLAINIVVSLILSIFHLTLLALIRWALLVNQADDIYFGRILFFAFTGSFHLNLLIYWALLGVIFAFDYYQKFNDQELTSAKLEKQLKQAQLNALQMQLQPHFLFNALNSISVLARKNDNQKVVEMIAGLGDLLRYSLKKNDAQEISLDDEIEFIKKYLTIEQTRFQDRMQVSFSISLETANARIPNLILQPIVENAVRHGVAASSNSSVIEISSAREENSLVLQVMDNGIGLPENWETENEKGVGLENTRMRLKNLYNESQSFEMHSPENGGVRVTIKIPFKLGETGLDSENKR